MPTPLRHTHPPASAEGLGSSVTVVTLTLNEEQALPGMLASIPSRWQVLVLDGGSRDRTRQLATRSGARVIDQDTDTISRAHGNFDVARNAATEQTSSEWLFFLDADERLTQELVSEIDHRLASGARDFNGFSIPRQNFFWDRPCRLLGEDRQLRLVRRGSGKYVGVELHQKILVQGAVGRLDHSMVHLNVRSWRDVLRRLRRYVPQQARALETRPSSIEILRQPFGLFRYYYIENQASKDGLRGLTMSLAYAVERGLALTLAWARRRAHA